ncbi:hypothetical protein [Xanthomonas campestris]|uniref:hypothetical protein n=1 Tax=Xanthomonas campestris TaxID=339 RepID=UPI0032E5286F
MNPSREESTQVHAHSSVHQMRAAAPTSKTHRDYSKVLELIGAYGDGEDITELRRRFPGFSGFLAESSLSRMSGMQMLRELNEGQRDEVIHQIMRRIENVLVPEDREIALSNLELACSQNMVLSQAALDRIAGAKAKAKAKAEESEEVKEAKEAKEAKSAISEIMGYLPRYEALEKVPSAVRFHNYLRGDGSFGRALLDTPRVS